MIKFSIHYGLWAIRGLFIVVNLLAAIGKLVSDSGASTTIIIFFDEIWGFIINDIWLNMIMVVIISTEFLMALFLLVAKRWLSWLFWVQGFIFLFFTFPLVFLWSRSQHIEACGCFGSFGFDFGFDLALELGILKNIVFMGLCLLGLYFFKKQPCRVTHEVQKIKI